MQVANQRSSKFGLEVESHPYAIQDRRRAAVFGNDPSQRLLDEMVPLQRYVTELTQVSQRLRRCRRLSATVYRSRFHMLTIQEANNLLGHYHVSRLHKHEV